MVFRPPRRSPRPEAEAVGAVPRRRAHHSDSLWWPGPPRAQPRGRGGRAQRGVGLGEFSPAVETQPPV